MEKSDNCKKPRDLRNWIAMIVTVSVIGITLVITFYYLIFTPDESVLDGTFIAQTLVPLWGTWIGTILAFYFSRENFEAATNSYKEVIEKLTPEEKIASLKVKDIMIPRKEIVCMAYDDNTKELSIVSDILGNKKFEKYNRYAFFDQNDVVKYVIHRSVFNQFLVSKVKEAKGLNIEDIKFKDLINEHDESIQEILKCGFATISLNANLLEAKNLMAALNKCEDVFITETGKNDQPVLGLITNNMILEYAKV